MERLDNITRVDFTIRKPRNQRLKVPSSTPITYLDQILNIRQRMQFPSRKSSGGDRKK